MRKFILMIVAVSLCGCATVPEERHGQELAAASVVVLAAGGIVLAKSLARHNAVQVHPTNRTVLGPP